MARSMIPDDLVAAGLAPRISVREVQCGDPACAPIDTAVEFWYDNRPDDEPHGFGMPLTSAEVTTEVGQVTAVH